MNNGRDRSKKWWDLNRGRKNRITKAILENSLMAINIDAILMRRFSSANNLTRIKGGGRMKNVLGKKVSSAEMQVTLKMQRSKLDQAQAKFSERMDQGR